MQINEAGNRQQVVAHGYAIVIVTKEAPAVGRVGVASAEAQIDARTNLLIHVRTNRAALIVGVLYNTFFLAIRARHVELGAVVATRNTHIGVAQVARVAKYFALVIIGFAFGSFEKGQAAPAKHIDNFGRIKVGVPKVTLDALKANVLAHVYPRLAGYAAFGLDDDNPGVGAGAVDGGRARPF